MTNETHLKQVAEEIKEILRKNDMAGAVILHKETCGEYFVHLHPTYSCAYQYNDNEIRFYSKLADYASKEEQHAKQNKTANMLSTLCDLAVFVAGGFINLSETFDNAVGGVHTAGKWDFDQ